MVYYIINQIQKQVGVEPPNSKVKVFFYCSLQFVQSHPSRGHAATKSESLFDEKHIGETSLCHQVLMVTFSQPSSVSPAKKTQL